MASGKDGGSTPENVVKQPLEARTGEEVSVDSDPVPAALRRSGSPVLVEVSFEVCCQAGGIYTVLRSKAPFTAQSWGRNYWMVGPYREASAKIEFEPSRPPRIIGSVLEELAQRGVRVHCGRWLITGRPQVLLIDIASVRTHLTQMKYYLWKDCGIGTPGDDWECDECVAFGYVVSDLLMALDQRLASHPLVVQFHEWQAGVALPVLRYRRATFATVFTTHATLVGRSLSAANVNLYEDLSTIDADRVAREHGFLHRHRLERAAATSADVFTTVSDITGQEAEVFFGRRAECLLPNGLNVERFAAPHEFQNLHQQAKEKIHKFVMGHFFPSYTFDLTRTLYVFSAGRYEYRNKGMDVFIDALWELNRRLKAEPNDITVVAFIIARANYRGHNVDTLNRQAMFNELRATCDSIREDMGRRLFEAVSAGQLPTIEDLLDEYDRVRLKRMIHAWRQGPPPTIVTHDLVDEVHDPVLARLRQRGLLNAADDPVKVIFHPEFLTAASPVLGVEYDEFVRGCNLGVFASYYEPWGYTPMECIVRGVPAVTSDLSGFGGYVMDHFPEHDSIGMYVARRRNVSLETTVYQVAGWLHDLTRMSLRDRIQLRNLVESHADKFDWAEMGRNYRTARRLALNKRYPERMRPGAGPPGRGAAQPPRNDRAAGRLRRGAPRDVRRNGPS
jgi:glycogen(starch) synthase